MAKKGLVPTENHDWEWTPESGVPMLSLRPVEITVERNKKRKGGSTDEPPQVYVSSLANENGWMPEVTISAGTGLTDYDLARAERYRQADGTLSAQGREFLKNVSAKRTTGKSQFMQDTDRLAAIPIGAASLAGGLAMAAAPAAAGYLTTALGGVPVVEALQNKDYGNAALEAGLGFLPIGAVGRKLGQGIKRVSKPLVNTVNKWLDPKPDLNVYDYWDRFKARATKKYGKDIFDDILFLDNNTPYSEQNMRVVLKKHSDDYASVMQKEYNLTEQETQYFADKYYNDFLNTAKISAFGYPRKYNMKGLVYTTNKFEETPMKSMFYYAIDKYGKKYVERGLIKPHETSHAIGKSEMPVPHDAMDFSRVSSGVENYLKKDLYDEVKARGTQLKDYFNKDKITARDLRYAANHYVKDIGFDNNMTDLFNSIKDYKKVAKWMSKYSPVVIPPILIGSKTQNNN